MYGLQLSTGLFVFYDKQIDIPKHGKMVIPVAFVTEDMFMSSFDELQNVEVDVERIVVTFQSDITVKDPG